MSKKVWRCITGSCLQVANSIQEQGYFNLNICFQLFSLMHIFDEQEKGRLKWTAVFLLTGLDGSSNGACKMGVIGQI